MGKGLAALANITAAATAAMLLHGCGSKKDDEPEVTENDLANAQGDHSHGRSDLVDGTPKNGKKHARAKPGPTDDVPGAETEGGKAKICTKKSDCPAPEKCEGLNENGKCTADECQCSVPNTIGKGKLMSAAEIAEAQAKNDPAKKTEDQQTAMAARGRSMTNALVDDAPDVIKMKKTGDGTVKMVSDAGTFPKGGGR